MYLDDVVPVLAMHGIQYSQGMESALAMHGICTGKVWDLCSQVMGTVLAGYGICAHHSNREVVVDDVTGYGIALLLLSRFWGTELNLPPIHHHH